MRYLLEQEADLLRADQSLLVGERRASRKSASARGHSRTLAGARSLPLGDTVFVERAVSQNTHPSSTGTSEPISVRPLTAPRHSEIEALADLFDKYRVHYGEACDTSSQQVGWNRTSAPTHARLSRKTVGGSSVSRSRWKYAHPCGSPISGRSEIFSSCLRTVVVESVVPFSAPSERLQSGRGALRLVVQTEEDNDPALRLYTDNGYALIDGHCSLMLPVRPETHGS